MDEIKMEQSGDNSIQIGEISGGIQDMSKNTITTGDNSIAIQADTVVLQTELLSDNSPLQKASEMSPRNYLFIDEQFVSMIYHQRWYRRMNTLASPTVYEIINDIEQNMEIFNLTEQLKNLTSHPYYWSLGKIASCEVNATQIVVNTVPAFLSGIDSLKIWISYDDTQESNLYLLESPSSNKKDISRPRYSAYSCFQCVLNSIQGIDIFDEDSYQKNKCIGDPIEYLIKNFDAVKLGTKKIHSVFQLRLLQNEPRSMFVGMFGYPLYIYENF